MDKQNKIPQNISFSPDGDRYVRSTDELDINNTNFDAGEDYRVHTDLLGKIHEAKAAESLSHGIGRLAARHATRKAVNTFDRHDAMIKSSYSPDGGLANEFAYEEANKQNEEYDINAELGKMADDLSKEFSEKKDGSNFESLDNFSKLDFIFNFAKGLSKDKKVPYIMSDQNSVTINGSYLTYEYLSIGLKSYGNAHTVARKIETKIIKGEDGLFEIDFTERYKEYADKNDRYSIWRDSNKLTEAYDRGDYDDIRRKGLAVAVKEVLSKEKLISDMPFKPTIEGPYKKILVSKHGNGSLLMPNYDLELPESIKQVSKKSEKEIIPEYGNYVEKPESKKEVKNLVDSLARTWIHGVVILPGLA